tara:strand:+ start:822 stop:1337 length:516 start_codon:yes stop_codon:yes gene_type:complete
MGVNIIVAYCKGNGIGKNNALPWYIPQDLKHFSNLTKGNNKINMIVMGRKTWDSLPRKPLPNRFNAILSNHLIIDNETTKTFKSLSQVVDFSRENGYQTLWVIGGAEIYKMALNLDIVDEIHVTEINEEHECDAFFPEISEDSYKLVLERDIGEKICYKIYRRYLHEASAL